MRQFLFILLFFAMMACFPKSDSPVPPPKLKYTVRLGNNIGHVDFQCEDYVKESNTYKLYNEGKLSNEITITNGYYLSIELNE